MSEAVFVILGRHPHFETAGLAQSGKVQVGSVAAVEASRHLGVEALGRALGGRG